MTLELGGKSANIIFADADLDHAVAGWSRRHLLAFRPDLQRAVPTLSSTAVSTARSSSGSSSLPPACTIGPRPRRLRRLRATASTHASWSGSDGYVERAGMQGADRPPWQPTIPEGLTGSSIPRRSSDDATDDMDCVREEIFGPVARGARPSTHRDEVHRTAPNASEYGLAAGCLEHQRQHRA